MSYLCLQFSTKCTRTNFFAVGKRKTQGLPLRMWWQYFPLFCTASLIQNLQLEFSMGYIFSSDIFLTCFGFFRYNLQQEREGGGKRLTTAGEVTVHWGYWQWNYISHAWISLGIVRLLTSWFLQVRVYHLSTLAYPYWRERLGEQMALDLACNKKADTVQFTNVVVLWTWNKTPALKPESFGI